MKNLLAGMLGLAVLGWSPVPMNAARDEEGLSEAAVPPEIAKNGDDEDAQALIQESDEDLSAFVLDYIRRDIQLKGAFLLEDKEAKRILKLSLVSVEQKAKDEPSGAKTVSAVFQDPASKKFTLIFHLHTGAWGGLDIFKIELRKPSAPPAKQKSRKP